MAFFYSTNNSTNQSCQTQRFVLRQPKSFWQIILLAWIVLAATECSSKDLNVVRFGREVGLRKPYLNNKALSGEIGGEFDKLVGVIHNNGGEIIVADRQLGILSWIDIGYTFHVPHTLEARFDRTVQLPDKKINLATWHGFVHASGRIKQMPDGLRVYIKAIARDESTNRIYCSDGYFESLILKQLNDTIPTSSDMFIKSREVSLKDSLSSVSTKEQEKLHNDYWELYYDHFKSLPPISATDVFTLGTIRIIPAKSNEVWEACLDLVWQYDGIVKLSEEEKVIVFARSLSSLRQAKDDIEPQFVDVLIAIALRDNPKGGTELAIAWLEPPQMKVRKVEVEKQLNNDPNQQSDKKGKVRQEGATVLSWRFLTELAVQLSWKEKLLNKLQ